MESNGHVGPIGRRRTQLVIRSPLVLGVAGSLWRTSVLDAGVLTPFAADGLPQVAAAPQGGGALQAPSTRLGDLSAFRVITQDTLRLVSGGDQAGATARARDLEIAWDDAQARLKPRDKAAWTTLDGKIDKVLRAIRATSPDPTEEKTALTALLDAVG